MSKGNKPAKNDKANKKPKKEKEPVKESLQSLSSFFTDKKAGAM